MGGNTWDTPHRCRPVLSGSSPADKLRGLIGLMTPGPLRHNFPWFPCPLMRGNFPLHSCSRTELFPGIYPGNRCCGSTGTKENPPEKSFSLGTSKRGQVRPSKRGEVNDSRDVLRITTGSTPIQRGCGATFKGLWRIQANRGRDKVLQERKGLYGGKDVRNPSLGCHEMEDQTLRQFVTFVIHPLGQEKHRGLTSFSTSSRGKHYK